jgi:hypothetical protein
MNMAYAEIKLVVRAVLSGKILKDVKSPSTHEMNGGLHPRSSHQILHIFSMTVSLVSATWRARLN